MNPPLTGSALSGSFRFLPGALGGDKFSERLLIAPQQVRGIDFSAQIGLLEHGFDSGEKAALVAFLKTLSDKKFLTDPKFSDPFQ